METYTPKIVELRGDSAYAEMLVELKKCEFCQSWMLPDMSEKRVFPLLREVDFTAQLKAAGWKISASSWYSDRQYCSECAANDKITFTCCLCKEVKTSSHIKERFGDPPDFLCKECFNTVPAAIWEKKTEELSKEHRYDFE